MTVTDLIADEKAEAAVAMPSVKSQPTYAPLVADKKARRHILVAESTGLNALAGLVAELEGMAESNNAEITVLWLGSAPAQLANHADFQAFGSLFDLREYLTHKLATSGMGLRLYLMGSESFIWQVNLAARAAGLKEDEIQREASGTKARRVFCVHCRNMMEGVTTNPVICVNCNVLLEVRDHFSRALAAYIGVVVNAEDPNDAPDIEEQFR